MPKYDDPLPKQFGDLTLDVAYQRGSFMEQYTVIYENATAGERALVKVRFSPYSDQIIEVDVELNPIPHADMQPKDVTVNFKMYNGFDPKGQFWTDSNTLEMQ